MRCTPSLAAVVTTCVLALAPAVASASITTYTDRSAWRTAMGFGTGDIIDDMNSSAQSNGNGANRGHYAISGDGAGGSFPNYNANTTVNNTGYLRCFTTGSTMPCTLTFASAQTGLVFDVNPQSTNVGATIAVTLNNSAGATSFVLSPANLTTTFGLKSTVAFTTVTIAGQAASTTAWHGIDDIEFAPAAPIVSSISPSSGSPAGGTGITITGAGFNVSGGTPTVSIGGTAATSVSVTDSRTITAVTPAGPLGAASVLVTPPGAAGANASNSLFTYALGAALTPAFGVPTPTADGFTVQATNYDASWAWSGTATAGGSVSVSNSGLVTVTGVAPSTSSAATITTTRAGYADGSGVVSETSQVGAALTPTFGGPTPTADGFTVQATNYDANWAWSGTATAGGSVSVSNSGLVTVTGVAAGTSSTVTIGTSRTGYTGGTAAVSGTALLPPPVGDAPGPTPVPAPTAGSGSGVDAPLATESAGVLALPVRRGRLPVRGIVATSAQGPVQAVVVPGRGVLTVTGWLAPLGQGQAALGSGTVVCRGRMVAPRAGRASITCTMSPAARAALRTHRMRVSLFTTFTGRTPARVLHVGRTAWVHIRSVRVTG